LRHVWRIRRAETVDDAGLQQQLRHGDVIMQAVQRVAQAL
jgi:hypothetical protein